VTGVQTCALPICYFRRGYSKAKQQDYYGAVQDYRKAIELGYSGYEIYMLRGEALFRTGDLEKQ
jgi:tetratricopeptide (TPR) repeat protein